MVLVPVFASVDELPVFLANFVRNRREMQDVAELAARDGPSQQRSEQTQQQPSRRLRKPKIRGRSSHEVPSQTQE